ncbi:uncharacterized protein LOC123711367 [Pieris brassicae]|uniref:uncharacterized protein LOC123711367 n=1 Tax=Pieris brassicae TaxID=7116 RepID=UPI001E660CFC|nr:uncharacterized protein LOC123711367 [Pieris brassicae]
MENDSHKITDELQKCSYRDLQLLSKHYGLPSNYKKLYLIQLIIARKMGLEESVTTIIEKVRKERQRMKHSKNRTRKSQMKTKKLQTFSPPITATPKLKLARNVIENHISKYNTRQSLLARLMNADTPKNIDAHKTLKQYENLSVRNFQRKTNQLVGEQIHKVKLTSQCIMKRQVNSDIIMRKDNVKVMYNTSATQTIAPLPAKRQRILSGIYPINPNPIVRLQKGDLTLRRNDGTVSKVNAFIQEKPPPTSEIIRDVLQDLERNNSENNLIHRNMSIDSAYCEANTSIETNDGIEILYYEKRVEQTKYETYKEDRLPKIADVFSKFNNRDYGQQLFVQVSAESEEGSYSTYMPQTIVQTIQLETIYNFKSLFTNSSLLQISTKSKTTCTNSTVTIMSTKVYPTSTVISHNAYPRYDVNYANGRDHVDMLLCKEPMQQPDNSDYLNNNIAESTSFDRNGGNVTIPEMVEDALEVISQDEEYMKCVDIDTKINCVLCNWCGPGIVVDYHIQKIHENEIMKQLTNDWNITFTLGALVQEPLWCSRVLEYESIFYVLSAKYEEPDVFMATLTSHSTDFTFKTGSITVFNKTTGEPFTWEGEIKCLSPDWPYTKNISGLKINLSKLDLMPQIYPIAGQPGLNDVHIILFARLYN